MKLEKKPPARPPAKRAAGVRGKAPDHQSGMGDALRSVYDKTVREAVPDEMLDLLSKLD